MDQFNYKNGQLFCEDVNLEELAKKVGTPFYVYSETTLKDHYNQFRDAFKSLNSLVCYSIKNCSNLHIIKVLADLNSGFDVVSGGELYRVLEAGADPSKVVFAGVGKSSEEIVQALEANIGWINIESEEELQNVSRIASQLKKKINVAIRINPNVYDPKTHQKTTTGIQDSKFGIDMSKSKSLYTTYLSDPYVNLVGLHIHLGSPIYTGDPYVKAIKKVLEFVEELKASDVKIEMIDIGGGYLANYTGTEETKSWDEYSSKIVPLLQDFSDAGGLVVFEPGRTIAANAGVLVSKVLYRKQGVEKKFIIVDTGMNHLIRPAFYDAYHFIWPVKVTQEQELSENRAISKELMSKLDKYDIVGPICESSDFLAKDRPFPAMLQNDLIAVFTAGSYCMTMASQYNSTPRPPEILVSKSEAKVIRKREVYEDLILLERDSEKIEL